MNETIPITVTIQLEYLAEQIVRAKPLGSWRIEVVGSSRAEVIERVRKRLMKQLAKMLPTDLFLETLPKKYEQWTTLVNLKPYERNTFWSEPVTVELESFRWQLETGQCAVRIPALGCNLIGIPADLDDSEVAHQAKVALIRQSESMSLLAVYQRFQQRSFEYHNFDVELNLNPEAEGADQEKALRKQTATLRSAASDLTRVKLSPAYEVDGQAAKVADHLVGENPQSVLLVGPAGVGKSVVVHQLVRERRKLGLEDRKVWTTTGARIVSGMSGLGMWQQRCGKMIKECFATKAILHLGSLFELLEAGKIDGSPGVASMIRHAISRGRLTAIAECTPEQLAVIERDDPILLRVFSRVEVKEADAPQIKSILAKTSEASNYNFSIQAIEELYRLHARFATYSALPAAALRLMRTMLGTQSQDSESIEADDVARAFAKQSGLPRFLFDDSQSLNLEEVRKALSSNVIGQSEPIDLIVNLIATLKARLVRPGRPLASLMFIGPTGVGKTEMAKAIARLLYSDTRRMVRIDMSEYASPWSTHKLIGKPGEGDGALTSPIREQPFSVVLLDEFEKADSNVFDLLLQLLGEGRLTDAQGRLADFRNAVVIMTSNLGVESFKESNFGFGETQRSDWREHFEQEVRRFVRPELLGRIDRIVPFEPLTRECVHQIAERELKLLRARAGLKFHDAELLYDAQAIELLSEIGYQPKYGARPLRRAIEEHITVPLANALSQVQHDAHWTFRVTGKDGRLAVESEKRSTKTESIKRFETTVVNAWQSLGAMARCALNSSPMRSVENDLERNRRLVETLYKRLKAAKGPSRVARLRQDLAEAEATIENARRLRKRLEAAADEIHSHQLQLMLAWYRNEEIDWKEAQKRAKRHRSVLRQVVEDVIAGRVAEGNIVTLFVTGKYRTELETIWKAYRQVAEHNHWLFDTYLVQPYDPLLDVKSPEYRKKQSENRGFQVDPAQVPDLRWKQKINEEESVFHCDLRRPSSPEEFQNLLAGSSGFALELRGDGVASWLGNEAGTTHFFDASETGERRRIRCKVHVSAAKVGEFEISESWQELTSTPDRDPRRIFAIDKRKLSDSTLGESVSYAKGKMAQALCEMIEKEHERALWKAIGFEGISTAAQLSTLDDEIPY